jgi:nicotinamidase-related amidase
MPRSPPSSADANGRVALVCLNLQDDYLNPSSPLYMENVESTLGTIGLVLSHARQKNWPIAHVHSRSAAPLSACGWPIPGLQPKPSEPTFFKRTYSAFRCESALQTIREFGANTTFVVGFAFALDCLATAYCAAEMGIQITFVEDAIGTPAMGQYSPETILRVVRSILSPLAEFVSAKAILGYPLNALMDSSNG